MPRFSGKQPAGEFALEDAIRRIYDEYGDVVSVIDKKKTLLKFGRSRTVGPSQRSSIAIFQDTGQPNEVYLTSNQGLALSSSDTGDFGTVFQVETHTLDTGTGFEFNTNATHARAKRLSGSETGRVAAVFMSSRSNGP